MVATSVVAVLVTGNLAGALIKGEQVAVLSIDHQPCAFGAGEKYGSAQAVARTTAAPARALCRCLQASLGLAAPSSICVCGLPQHALASMRVSDRHSVGGSAERVGGAWVCSMRGA